MNEGPRNNIRTRLLVIPLFPAPCSPRPAFYNHEVVLITTQFISPVAIYFWGPSALDIRTHTRIHAYKRTH